MSKANVGVALLVNQVWISDFLLYMFAVVMYIPPTFPEELIGYDMVKKAAKFSQAGEEVCIQKLQFVTIRIARYL